MPYLAEKHVETNIASAAIRLLPQNATNSVFPIHYLSYFPQVLVFQSIICPTNT